MATKGVFYSDGSVFIPPGTQVRGESTWDRTQQRGTWVRALRSTPTRTGRSVRVFWKSNGYLVSALTKPAASYRR